MTPETKVLSKRTEAGVPPAIMLENPKFPHNIGAALRAASCFGFEQLWYTGDRMQKQLDGMKRIPREERMKGYKDVQWIHYDYPLEQFPKYVSPVAVEIVPNAESLVDFQHPEHAIYVFGPEDGSISKPVRARCHRFITIPTRHCVNLAAAVYIVLFHRMNQRYLAGREEPPMPAAYEQRGWWDTETAVEKLGLA